MHQLLIDGANRYPDRPAFTWVDRERTVTYEEMVDLMERAAGAFASVGVARGDRVCIFAHNGLDYLAGMFGAWRIGAIAALVNVQYAAELEYYLADHDPKAILYTHDHHANVERARIAAPSLTHALCMDGLMDGALSWPDLTAAALPVPVGTSADSDPAHLSYTSGTSGRPKGAVIAHEPTMRATRCIAERLRMSHDDITFGPTALSSSYQLVANLLPGLHHGCHVHVMGKWTGSTGVDALVASGATILAANPIVLTDVLNEARARDGAPPQLRMGVSGGGPVPPSLKRAWRDELALPLVESYGQSELGGFVALAAPSLPVDDADIAAIGRPLPDKEVRILDDDGNETPIGTPGEICLRGGYMWGYWGRADKTAEATRGDWLHTGDIGVMDATGRVRLRSRLSERLKVGGEYWYPRDVEEALLEGDGVQLAAVVGVPDETLGQRPVAYLVTVGEIDLTEVIEQARVKSTLPLDLLDVRTLAELPMTPTGKIAKSDLAALAAVS